ncbi:hypothetical protein [Kribbella swartbergensis]
MSDPTSQPPPPYGAPDQRPYDGPHQHPYGAPSQPPYDAPHQHPYDGQHQPPYLQPYGQPGHHHPKPQPQRKSQLPWLLAGAIALVVALVGGAGVVLATRGDGSNATSSSPTASYTDGLTSTTVPSPTEPPTESPTEPPTYTPSEPVPTPTPERTRTLRDIDQGVQVYDDVYVKPAGGWRKYRQTKYTVTLGSQSKFGVLAVVVQPVGYPAETAVASVAQGMIDVDKLTGVKKGAVKTLRPANSNIAGQAQLEFSGRFRQNGVTVSLKGRCTAMTGVESIHNVTVTVCVEARRDSTAAAFGDATRMLTSVARSI